MRPIGFSTGALALGDFRTALGLLAKTSTRSVELSALRDHELVPLMEALGKLDLRRFSYVSIHVPSKFQLLSEAEVADQLSGCVAFGLPIVIHPDVIRDSSVWAPFGAFLCIENMDKRKHTGRTVAELDAFFSMFPDATFCLDIAHGRQIDPTMTETRQMLRRFGDRLRQVHISEIDGAGHHGRLSLATILAAQSLAHLISQEIPIIIESQIAAEDIDREVRAVERALTTANLGASTYECADWGALA